MSAWKTSEHRLPIALTSDTPVMRSAALLKEVMRQSLSTVNTPSAMELKIVWKNHFSLSGFIGRRNSKRRARIEPAHCT